MKIDCDIEDICKICMKKSQITNLGTSLNAHYIHPYAGIHNEGGVGRMYFIVGPNLVSCRTGQVGIGREWSLCGRA